MSSYKELIVWQKSMKLAKLIYTLTQQLPSDERFGLTSQMRRAAVSIPSNIAEGRERSTRKDYTQFLRVANGSSSELETQLILAQDLYNIDIQESQNLLVEIQKMLSVMIRKLAA